MENEYYPIPEAGKFITEIYGIEKLHVSFYDDSNDEWTYAINRILELIMLILIIEDELSKLDEIRNHILNKYAEYHPKIDTAGNLCDAKKKNFIKQL